MTTEHLTMLLSVVLGILLVGLLRRFDIHEQEPLWAMLAVAVWGGFWSVVLTFIGYWSLSLFGVNDPTSQLGPLLIVGPVEESAKLLALATSYPIIRRELDEPTDGLIYMACVALGFSLIENYFYSVGSASTGQILILRLVVCTPMHVLFAAPMGLAFYQVVKGQAPRVVLLISLGIASLAHGLYDLVIINSWAAWALLIIVWFTYWWVVKLLGYTTAASPHRRTLAQFVADQDDAPLQEGLRCLNCGSEGDKATFRHGRIVFQKCDGCAAYVISHKALKHLFRHYGAAFGRLGRHRISAVPGEREYGTLFDGNYIAEDEGLAFFFLDEQDAALEQLNRLVIARHERNPIFRRFVGVAAGPGAEVPVATADAGEKQKADEET
jgi:RsiW-degrading membrane proteinase PrsW (M82 family)